MFESPNYDLTPEGNFSKVKNKKINEEYEIGISDINRTKDKFNRGMEAYLQYLNEFVTFLITNKKIKICLQFIIVFIKRHNRDIVAGKNK